jgi:hypothetical protein
LEKLEKKDGEQNTAATTTKTQPADPFPISGGNDGNDLPF